MAKGMPSSRRHTCATACPFRVDDDPSDGPKIEVLLAIHALLLFCPTRRRQKPPFPVSRLSG
jgi:hypothetical protein